MSSFMFEKYNALDSTSLNGRLTSVLAHILPKTVLSPDNNINR